MKLSLFKYTTLIALLLMIISCGDDDSFRSKKTGFISAADISSFPEISESNPVFYNADGIAEDVLSILKNSGVNTIRLRLWVDPSNGHSGFNEVKAFSETLRTKGFNIWLSLHYSDTWADPGQQTTPVQWQGIPFTALKDSVYQYTKRIVNSIHPDFIQIGNEINSGMLFPHGHIDGQFQQFKALLAMGVQAVRDHSNTAKVIIHFAGIENAEWFYTQIHDIDYDIIGLSFYPRWHGKDLDMLKALLEDLSAAFDKEMLIAETAYPFTLAWNDWTNNNVGLEEQLILPEFPATPEGQRGFVNAIKAIVSQTDRGIGFCYWGGELIAFDGPESVSGSNWENQALFDFNNVALPVLNEFKQE